MEEYTKSQTLTSIYTLIDRCTHTDLNTHMHYTQDRQKHSPIPLTMCKQNKGSQEKDHSISGDRKVKCIDDFVLRSLRRHGESRNALN